MFNKNSSINIIKAEKGFTLIELLIVVTIIGILAAIAIPSYIGTQEKERRSNLIKAVRSSESDLQNWINSALKGSVATALGANLTEVDTNWNGTVRAASDLTNAGLFALTGVANSSVTGCYTAARTQSIGVGSNAACGTAAAVAEMSPWSGMGTLAAPYYFYASVVGAAPAVGTVTGNEGRVTHLEDHSGRHPIDVGTVTGNEGRVTLFAPPLSANSITVLAASNGPGGADTANAEELDRKMVTAE